MREEHSSPTSSLTDERHDTVSSGQGAKNTSHFHIVTLLHPSSTSFAKPSFKANGRFACCSS